MAASARSTCAPGGRVPGPQGFHWHKLDFHMVYILAGRVTYRWQGSDEDVVVGGGWLPVPAAGRRA